MKWYEPIECSNAVDNPLVTTDAFFGAIEASVLRKGLLIQGWEDSFWVRATTEEDDGEPDDVLQTHLQGLPVYSACLRRELARIGITGIQYLPINVFHHDGTPAPGFAVGNLLNVVLALDLAHSRYSVYGDNRPDRKGELSGVRKAVLKRDVVEGYDIFRLREFPIFICVSERFKDAFEAGGFTGYNFKELETI